MYHISQSRRHRPSVWTFNRASEGWDVIVPGFTNTQCWKTLECLKKQLSICATNCIQWWRDWTQTSACVYLWGKE